MSDELKKGDAVKWESSQGEVHGTVEKKLTQPADIKGHHVAASKDNPEFLVKSDKTGKEAAHKPESLQKEGN
jgi:Hypervirulence associated proteins TUDOR domain